MVTFTRALGVSLSESFELGTPLWGGVTFVWVLAAHKVSLGVLFKGPQANWEEKANTGLRLGTPAFARSHLRSQWRKVVIPL